MGHRFWVPLQYIQCKRQGLGLLVTHLVVGKLRRDSHTEVHARLGAMAHARSSWRSDKLRRGRNFHIGWAVFFIVFYGVWDYSFVIRYIAVTLTALCECF